MKYYAKLGDLAFTHKEQLVRNAAIWSLGEFNNKDIIEELLRKYRSHPHGWDEEKYEMLISLLKLGESSFSPIKAEQLLKKEYVLTRQKEMLRLMLKERGIFYSIKENAKRIFIAFVLEDKIRAENLYKKLKEAGHNPWIYTKDAEPGTRWKENIHRIMSSCDFVIATFSKRSESKDGYFNTEIRKALEILDTKAPSKSFLIPLKFEKCKVPEMKAVTTYLRDLH